MNLQENIHRIKQVMGLLTEDQNNYLNQPIVFVGSAGAGKSTTAHAVSKQLGIPYIDVDEQEGNEEFEKSCANDGIVVNIKRVNGHNYGPQNLKNIPENEWVQIQDQYKRCVLAKILQKYGDTKVVIDIGGGSIKNYDLLNNLSNLFVFGVPPSPDEDAPYIEMIRKRRQLRAAKMGQPELESDINNNQIQRSINSIREYYRGKQNISPFDDTRREKTTEELVGEIIAKLT